ncbi:MAG: hypothetical protein U5K54_18515 [Cytophagales bacterium]|nr:hypothetical protein [Cytophagales bacterium]
MTKNLNGLEQASDFIYTQDVIAVASKKEKELRLMIGNPDGTFVVDTLLTQLTNPNEIIRNESDSNSFTRFWYRNVLYVWGYQAIRNTQRKEENTSRDVFYINKIEVR